MTRLLHGVHPPARQRTRAAFHPEGELCVHRSHGTSLSAVLARLRAARSRDVNRSKIYHVRPHATEGWKVEHEGARRPSGVLTTRAAAIQRAQQLARLAGSDHIVIHDRKGRVNQTVVENVVPRNSVEYEADGSDPRD